MSNVVYHFTDTARLPWILLDDELRPGRNHLGGLPDPDFLWATTSPMGDRTAAACLRSWRSGLTRLVRFVLHESDFLAWPAAALDCPDWTQAHVAILERAARGRSRPEDWRCRAEPLNAEAWVSVETRGYSDRAWQKLAPGDNVMWFGEDTVGLQIGDKVYLSTRRSHPLGVDAYSVQISTRRDPA